MADDSPPGTPPAVDVGEFQLKPVRTLGWLDLQ